MNAPFEVYVIKNKRFRKKLLKHEDQELQDLKRSVLHRPRLGCKRGEGDTE